MMGTSIVTETAKESKTDLAFVTYDYAFEQWLIRHDKSENTARLYLTGLDDFRTWFERKLGKSLDPALITPLDVRAYRRYLVEERRLKPNSVNSYLAALRAFCQWAMDQELIQGDPTSGIKGVKIEDLAPRWLDRQEQYRLLRAAEERVQIGDVKAGGDTSAPAYIRPRRDRAIVVLMLNTGLRLSEVAALRLDDVEIKPRSGKVIVRSGKGRKSRTVKLNKDARKALSAWLEVRPEIEGEDAIFISQKGSAMAARSIARRVKHIGRKAGVDLTPHMLRHSLGKNMVDSGTPLDRVAKALGHANLDTTKRYTLPSEADMQTAMEKVAWSD
jgi:integrase/recombinase XerC